jgi:hypothetical protein
MRAERDRPLRARLSGRSTRASQARRSVLCFVTGTIFAGLAASEPVSSQSFEAAAHATVLHTGNSLSLSGEMNSNGPGVTTSGHTLTCLDVAQVDDDPESMGTPWFPGTTDDYTIDGSAALLSLPPQSNVLYAELIWGGSFKYGGEDLTSVLDQPVTLTTPAGRSFSIAPDPLLSHTLDFVAGSGFPVAYYLRGADVTSRVASAGVGAFAVEGVPVTQGEFENNSNGGGWALIVVVESAPAPCRSIALQTVGGWVEEDSSASTVFANLATPAGGSIAGRVVVGAVAGDASRTGDVLAVLMPGTSIYLPLSGPNNLISNFFESQINGGDGLLDLNGTFGLRNHDANGQSQLSGGRQGWDLTAVPLDSANGHLAPDQTEATLRFSSDGDSYVAAFAAFEADSVGPCDAPGTGIFSDGFENGDMDLWSRIVL